MRSPSPLHIPVPVLRLLLLAAGGVHGGFHLVQLHQILPVPVLRLLLLAAGGVHGGFHLVQLHQILPDRLVRGAFLLVRLLRLAVLRPPLGKG